MVYVNLISCLCFLLEKFACSLKELIDFYKKRKRIKKYVVGSDKIPINSMLLGDDHSAIAEGRIPINLMAIMRLVWKFISKLLLHILYLLIVLFVANQVCGN